MTKTMTRIIDIISPSPISHETDSSPTTPRSPGPHDDTDTMDSASLNASITRVPSPPSPTVLIPDALEGRYNTMQHIGDGSFKTVYSARHNDSDEPVALLAIPFEGLNDVFHGLSVVDDAFKGNPPQDRLAGLLGAPDNAPMANDKLWFEDKLCDGNLTSIQNKPAQFLDALRKTASTLRMFHQSGIAHGDVRPDNILTQGNDSYLTDFDLAQKLGKLNLTENGVPNNPYRDKLSSDLDGKGLLLHTSDIYSLAKIAQKNPNATALQPGLNEAVDDVIQADKYLYVYLNHNFVIRTQLAEGNATQKKAALDEIDRQFPQYAKLMNLLAP